jgi:hypothetical protein
MEEGVAAPVIGELLRERTDAIIERWVEVVLSSYPSEAAVLFQKEKDPFANPIGGTVRRGTRGIFQAILNGMDPAELRSHLDEIVRVRAVQDLTPSQALSFVFSLRSIVREVIPELDADPRFHREVAELDAKIDRVALTAFDVYAECREEVNQLRINDVKRQVAWVFEKMNKSNAGDPAPLEAIDGSTPASENVQREDLR